MPTVESQRIGGTLELLSTTAPVQALLWLTTDVQPFTRTIAATISA